MFFHSFIFCTYITILSEPTFPIYVPFAGILQHSSLCSGVPAKMFNNQLSRKTKCVYICILIKFIMYRTEFTKNIETCNILYCKFHIPKTSVWYHFLNIHYQFLQFYCQPKCHNETMNICLLIIQFSQEFLISLTNECSYSTKVDL